MRSIEVHGAKAGEGQSGQRVALSLPGVATEDLTRGDWVAEPGKYRATSTVDCLLRVLSDRPKSLKHGTRIRFHLGASEVLGRIVVLGGDVIEPGSAGYVQIRLERIVHELRAQDSNLLEVDLEGRCDKKLSIE